MQERYLDRREAADYLTPNRGLKISRNTLQKMATLGAARLTASLADSRRLRKSGPRRMGPPRSFRQA